MFDKSQEFLVLKSFIESLPAGSYITYADIEKTTGIEMASRGKSLLRSAIRSCGLEYRSDYGLGIELESDKNAMQLVTGRVRRVSNGLRRADKTTMRMTERYIEKLPEEDKNRLLATASLFGAIKSLSKGLTSIYKPKKLNTAERIDIPKFE